MGVVCHRGHVLAEQHFHSRVTRARDFSLLEHDERYGDFPGLGRILD